MEAVLQTCCRMRSLEKALVLLGTVYVDTARARQPGDVQERLASLIEALADKARRLNFPAAWALWRHCRRDGAVGAGAGQ